MKRLGLGIAAVLAGAQFMACGKSGDHLYHYVPPPPKNVTSESKVLEFVGPVQLDIVWVIDNSGSMGPYQKAVIENAEKFMQEFTKTAKIRWQMGLISTDDGTNLSQSPPDFHKEYGFTPGTALNYRSQDNVERFKQAVNDLGIRGSGYERVFTPTRMLLRDRHPDFLSRRGVLVLIILTDAPEQSATSNPPISTDQFLNWVKSIRTNELKDVRVFGILNPRDWGCPIDPDESQFYWPSSAFERLFQQTQGETFKICDPDFGKNLAKIGKTIAELVVTPKILLTGRPKPATLEVIFQGSPLPRGNPQSGGVWTYDVENNSIIFHDLDFLDTQMDDVQVEVQFDEDDGHGQDR